MIRTHRSAAGTPAQRGEEFGSVNAAPVAETLARYRDLFGAAGCGSVDLRAAGVEALAAIGAFSKDAQAEIRALAGGAGVEPWEIAALNARTEILARFETAAAAECSTVVVLPPDGQDPLTLQTWDWHDSFDGSWLAWTIEHPDGRVVHTLTEYGILGKIGVSSRGVGVHVNLLTHRRDGGAMGVPVHILARAVLDHADDPGAAVALLGPARTSASTVLTIVGASADGSTAVCAELAPPGPRFVIPSERGLLLHTNHFLDPHLSADDRAPRWGPDSYLRLEVLQRRLHEHLPSNRDQLREIFSDHSGGAGSICCHPDPDATLGHRWETLATTSLDVRHGDLWVLEGAPCGDADWHRCSIAAAATV